MEQAIDYHEQALAIAREIGDRRGEWNHLANLGVAYEKLGQMEKARNHRQAAFEIYEEIMDPNAERVRGWLEDEENN